MLRRRLAGANPSSTDTHDTRTAKEILQAAANAIGMEEGTTDAIVKSLEAESIKHAWQLAHLPFDAWSRIGQGVSMGLITAVKEILENGPPPSDDAPPPLCCDVELTPRLRNFLLLPGEDGSPPKPMCMGSTMLYSALCTTIEHRQAMMLACCELLALLNGLFLAVPLGFMRTREPDFSAEGGDVKGFNVPPTIDDGIATTGMIGFGASLTAAIVAVMTGIVVAAAGNQAGNAFYEALFKVIVGIFSTFFFVMAFAIVQIMWHTITLSSCPWLLVGCFLIEIQPLNALDCLMFRLLADGCALEMYHAPRFVKFVMYNNFPLLMKDKSGKSILRDEVILPKAERRAAVLRAKLGIDLTPPRLAVEHASARVAPG